jgi:hypothetical protein
MVLPRWIPFLVAAWVIAFGILRLRIATRKDDEEQEAKPNFRKGGYYARSKRSHALFGVAYLILGGYCIAMGFGYSFDIIGACQGKQSQSQPAADERGVQVDVTE